MGVVLAWAAAPDKVASFAPKQGEVQDDAHETQQLAAGPSPAAAEALGEGAARHRVVEEGGDLGAGAEVDAGLVEGGAKGPPEDDDGVLEGGAQQGDGDGDTGP